jgi:hypothetical protein
MPTGVTSQLFITIQLFKTGAFGPRIAVTGGSPQLLMLLCFANHIASPCARPVPVIQCEEIHNALLNFIQREADT